MADFKQVAGQLEGLWRASVEEAEAQGRVAGEAAGAERVLRVAEALLGEEESPEWRTPGRLLAELRRRVGAAPAVPQETASEPEAKRHRRA